MPHLVSSLFSENLSAFKESVALVLHPSPKKTKRPLSPQDVNRDDDPQRPLKRRQSVLASLTSPNRKKNRLSKVFSLTTPHFNKSKSIEEFPTRLQWSMESPEIVFHGDVESSSGAILTGQFIVYNDASVDLKLQKLVATLRVKIIQKKPFRDRCPECTSKVISLKDWEIVASSTTLRPGCLNFPISTHLPGSLSPSFESDYLSVRYELSAFAIVSSPRSADDRDVNAFHPLMDKFLQISKPICIKRAFPPSDHEHHSVRIFPPTNIQVDAHFQQNIRPNCQNNVTITMKGLSSISDSDPSHFEIWRLKKVTWSLDETVRSIAPACRQHTAEVDDSEETEPKGLSLREHHTLGHKILTEGWKSEYTQEKGQVDLLLDFGVRMNKHGNYPKHVPDTKNRLPITIDPGNSLGLSTVPGTADVTHSLMVEFIVARERAPINQPTHFTPTGVARVLRMHFKVFLSDAPGNLSWDEEMPPLYDQVPPSPPSYSLCSPTWDTASRPTPAFPDLPPPSFEGAVAGHFSSDQMKTETMEIDDDIAPLSSPRQSHYAPSLFSRQSVDFSSPSPSRLWTPTPESGRSSIDWHSGRNTFQ